MSIFALDEFVPFLAFAYGIMMLIISHSDRIQKLAQQTVPDNLWLQVMSHRPIALFCFWFGGLWTLQTVLS